MKKLIATALLATTIATAAPANAYGGWQEMLQPGNARPCKYEDTGRNCVWDARHRGNGIGRSFARGPKGGVHFITHRTAHRALHG